MYRKSPLILLEFPFTPNELVSEILLMNSLMGFACAWLSQKVVQKRSSLTKIVWEERVKTMSISALLFLVYL